MSQNPKKRTTLLQDLQNIEVLRQGAKLTEQEHMLMKAGVQRLLNLVNDTYPDQPASNGAESLLDANKNPAPVTAGPGPSGPGDELR